MIVYATCMYNYWTFEGKPYDVAFQDFWKELHPGNWWLFSLTANAMEYILMLSWAAIMTSPYF